MAHPRTDSPTTVTEHPTMDTNNVGRTIFMPRESDMAFNIQDTINYHLDLYHDGGISAGTWAMIHTGLHRLQFERHLDFQIMMPDYEEINAPFIFLEPWFDTYGVEATFEPIDLSYSDTDSTISDSESLFGDINDADLLEMVQMIEEEQNENPLFMDDYTENPDQVNYYTQ